MGAGPVGGVVYYGVSLFGSGRRGCFAVRHGTGKEGGGDDRNRRGIVGHVDAVGEFREDEGREEGGREE